MLRTAEHAAREAGKILLKHFGKSYSVSHKGKDDVVSSVDVEAEHAVIKILSNKFPSHSMICEESGYISGSDKYTWLIDALDGTMNYTRGLEPFCVSIGLLKNGKPYIGVVYDPLFNEMYSAEKGKGAHLNGIPMHVSGRPELQDALLAADLTTHKSHHANFHKMFKKLSKEVLGIRVTNSTSLNLAHVAAGRFDGYVKNKMKYHDLAPGAVLIEEAGGKVTDWDGKKSHAQMKNVVCGNPRNHKKLRQLLA